MVCVPAERTWNTMNRFGMSIRFGVSEDEIPSS